MVGSELSGGRVNLRPLRDDDLPRRVVWMNDEETVTLFTGTPPARTYELAEAQRWRLNLEADPAAVVWAIESEWGHHIGDVDLHSIDRNQKSAKLTVLLGDKNYWNHGYGTLALKALLNYAFKKMDLESVDLRVYEFNKRGIRCYEKCGFKQVGQKWVDRSDMSGPNEIHMTVTKLRFLAEEPDAVAAVQT